MITAADGTETMDVDEQPAVEKAEVEETATVEKAEAAETAAPAEAAETVAPAEEEEKDWFEAAREEAAKKEKVKTEEDKTEGETAGEIFTVEDDGKDFVVNEGAPFNLTPFIPLSCFRVQISNLHCNISLLFYTFLYN